MYSAYATRTHSKTVNARYTLRNKSHWTTEATLKGSTHLIEEKDESKVQTFMMMVMMMMMMMMMCIT
jgi:hypothetical protein